MANLDSEDLRSYILAGCQMLFATTTVAGAALLWRSRGCAGRVKVWRQRIPTVIVDEACQCRELETMVVGSSGLGGARCTRLN